jgi:hypothetical protein
MRGAMGKHASRSYFDGAAIGGLFLLLAMLGIAQQIIENPKNPASKNAGRVLPLKEAARITDEKGKFFFVSPRGVGIMSISRAIPLSVDDRLVFVFHSPEYLIKCLDLETGEIVRAFRREYVRVPYDDKAPAGYPQELVPKYHNDLCQLLWRNGELWAVTSTLDPRKGILVDVFSREGMYLDNFYLPLFKVRKDNPQYYAPMAIHGDFLYLLEADEDDLISLVKYEIGKE